MMLFKRHVKVSKCHSLQQKICIYETMSSISSFVIMMEVRCSIVTFTVLVIKTISTAADVDTCICDEVFPQVWFDPVAYIVNEDAGTVTLTINTNIAGGPPDGDVVFSTDDGTALGIYTCY